MHYLARSKSRLKIVGSVSRTVSQFCLRYLFEERCMYCSIDKIEVIQLVFYVVNNYYDLELADLKFSILHWLSLRPPNFVSSFFIRFTLTLTLTTEPPINRGFQPDCEGVRVTK